MAQRFACPCTTTRLAEEFSLWLHIGPDLRPTLNKRCCGNACQFARLNLVQTATINTAFATEFVASDLTEQSMDGFGTARMSAKHRREAVLWVEHQVKIGSNRLRAVPDEAERLFVSRAAAHVCAEEGGGRSLFLLVPRAALADQITIHDAKRLGSFQVIPKGRVLGLDHWFGQVAIDHAQLAVKEGISITVSVNARGLEMTRTGKDWAEVLARKSEALRVGAVEHEKLVAAGGDTSLDAEEVAKRRAFTVAKRVSVVFGVTRVHGPLARLA